jgi:hypothetical protein
MIDRDYLLEGLQWYLSSHGFLPWYHIGRGASHETADDGMDYSAPLANALLSYRASGRSMLASYIEEAEGAEANQDRKRIYTAHLWKMVQSRRAEVKYIVAHELQRLFPLIVDLRQLAESWQWIELKSKLDARSSRRRSVANDLRAILSAEDVYFEKLEKILHAN